jgi:antitoxin component YwqK of YwqJK toxin-antitoxin module
MLYLSKLFGLFVILSFAACEQNSNTFIIELKDEGNTYVKEKQIYNSKDSLATGLWEVYAPNGYVVDQRPFTEGKLHGTRKIFDDSGRLQIEENYEKGEFQGPYLAYFSNGNIRVKGQYKNNAMDSVWEYFYANGQVKERVFFNLNQENGPFEEFYENGFKKAVGTYRNGDKEEGRLELYDSLGTLEKVMECNFGICRTTWKRDSN